MKLKEKIALLLKEGLLTEEEAKLLNGKIGGDTEKVETEEKVEAKPNEKVEAIKKEVEPAVDAKSAPDEDAHPNIKDDAPTETADKIKAEAKTETLEDEASETPQEQASEENALLKAVDDAKANPSAMDVTADQVEELKKANEGLNARLGALEELVKTLSVPVNPNNAGVGTGGYVANNSNRNSEHEAFMARYGRKID